MREYNRAKSIEHEAHSSTKHRAQRTEDRAQSKEHRAQSTEHSTEKSTKHKT